MRGATLTAAPWSSTPCVCPSTAALTPRGQHRRPGVQAARGAAVLERTAERVEEMEPFSYEVYFDTDLAKEFQEYSRATQQLEELESLQAQLMTSVQTMDSIWLSPPQLQESTETPEARRARRQQSRAARKMGLSPQPSTATASVSVTSPATAVPSLALPVVDLPSTSHAAPTPAPAPSRQSQPRASTSRTSAVSGSRTQQLAVAPVPSRSVSTSTPSTSAPASQLALPGPGLSLAPVAGTTARDRQQVRASRNATRRASSTSGAAARIASGKGSSSSQDVTSQFLKNASSTALLKPEEQKEVATVVKDFLYLKSIEKELKGILKRAPTIAEWAKAVKAEDVGEFQTRVQRGQDAKARMLKANYRLVIKVVKAYQNRGMSLQDLIAEGMQGLLRGVEKFEVDKGFRFSTYAHWWIRQAVTRALQEQARTVRVPYHVHEQVARIATAKAELVKKLQRQPTMAELCAATGMTADRIQEALSANSAVASLESPAVGDDDGAGELKDTLADDRAQPDEIFAEDMVKENLLEVLKFLNPREATVLKMHWGLDGHKEMTLEEIGAHFKITRERVRQLEARAMRQLKENQHKLQSIMGELQTMPVDEVEFTGRASRGTKKT